MIVKIAILIGGLLVLRIIICLSKLIQIKKYYNLYLEYLKSPSFTFSEKKPQIIRLFKEADIDNFVVTRLEPAGYGQVAKIPINGFENITLVDYEVMQLIKSKFHEAIGVFKHRLFQNFNPVFWIEFIFKLPEYILIYLGFKSENVFVRIIQVMYWILGIIIGLEELGIIDILNTS